MPVSSDVRERLRAAQQAETEAIAAVQKALVAEAVRRHEGKGLQLGLANRTQRRIHLTVLVVAVGRLLWVWRRRRPALGTPLTA